MSIGEIRICRLSGDKRSEFIEGYLANGMKKVGDNPYPEDTDSHWNWMDGFVCASEDREKRNG